MSDKPVSTLLQYLPAVYHQDPFLGQFLLAFEKLLLGIANDGVSYPAVDVNFPARGLEETIAALPDYFDPARAPEEFLPWLAGWTAFSLRAELSTAKQRDFIAGAIHLYRGRGTKTNLKELLEIFTEGSPDISENQGSGLQIGVHSTIGKDTYLGDSPPFIFHVSIALQQPTPAVLDRQRAIARALIDLEKPAHTSYTLDLIFPTMQIHKHSTVGVDTLLGTATT